MPFIGELAGFTFDPEKDRYFPSQSAQGGRTTGRAKIMQWKKYSVVFLFLLHDKHNRNI